MKNIPKIKTAYLDCSSGISGDMFISALLDAGVPLGHIEKELSKLAIGNFKLKKKDVLRSGMRATMLSVKIGNPAPKPRKWNTIKKIVSTSALDPELKKQGLIFFEKIFAAEARVHGMRMEEIHLHELGAVDCIIDVFSVLVGLRFLGIEEIYSSAVNLGSGTILTEHGVLPVPAPATMELLKGAEVCSRNLPYELTTPTGALLLSGLSKGFGPMPDMSILKYGIGAGSRDIPQVPNILRIIIGERGTENASGDVFLVEANIDDMNPQFYEYLMEMLFGAGALDVFFTNILMKKQRPGIKVSVLVYEENIHVVAGIITRETTSIGVRFCKYGRIVLKRDFIKLKTEFGPVLFKRIYREAKVHRIYPEYEECKKIAERTGLPLVKIAERLAVFASSQT